VNIAECVMQLKEDFDAVYEAGKANGTDGGNSSYNIFWDNFQENGERQDYNLAFTGVGWNENTFCPKYNIYPVDGSYMFQKCRYKADLTSVLNTLGVSLDLSRCTGYNSMFYQSAFTRIPKIVDRFTSNAISIFNSCSNLITIDEIEMQQDFTASGHYRDAFTGCTALENIKFTGTGKLAATISFQSCPLSKASIVNIMDKLSNTASGVTLTLKLTAVQKAFETASGANDGNTSEEWLNLTATKSNWTITLI